MYRFLRGAICWLKLLYPIIRVSTFCKMSKILKMEKEKERESERPFIFTVEITRK